MASDPLRNGSIFSLIPSNRGGRKPLRKPDVKNEANRIAIEDARLIRAKLDDLYRSTPKPFQLQASRPTEIQKLRKPITMPLPVNDTHTVVEYFQPGESHSEPQEDNRAESPQYFRDSESPVKAVDPMVSTSLSSSMVTTVPTPPPISSPVKLVESTSPSKDAHVGPPMEDADADTPPQLPPPETPTSWSIRPIKPISMSQIDDVEQNPSPRQKLHGSVPRLRTAERSERMLSKTPDRHGIESQSSAITSASGRLIQPTVLASAIVEFGMQSPVLPPSIDTKAKAVPAPIVHEMTQSSPTTPSMAISRASGIATPSSSAVPTAQLMATSIPSPAPAQPAVSAVLPPSPVYAISEPSVDMSHLQPDMSQSARKARRSARAGAPSLLAIISQPIETQAPSATEASSTPSKVPVAAVEHPKASNKKPRSSSTKASLPDSSSPASRALLPTKSMKSGSTEAIIASPSPSPGLKRKLGATQVQRSPGSSSMGMDLRLEDEKPAVDESDSSPRLPVEVESSSGARSKSRAKAAPAGKKGGTGRSTRQSQPSVPSSRQVLAASLLLVDSKAKPKPKEWSRAEAVALYQCHRDTDVNTPDFWQQVSNKMKAMGVERMADECEQRFYKALQERQEKQKKIADQRLAVKSQQVHAKLQARNAGSGPRDLTKDRVAEADDSAASSKEEEGGKKAKKPRLTKQDFMVLSQEAARAKKADDVFEKYPARPQLSLPSSLPVPNTPSDCSRAASPFRADDTNEPLFQTNRRHEIKRKITPTLLESYDPQTIQARQTGQPTKGGMRMQGISAAAAMIGNVRQRSRMLSAAISSTVTRELRNATRDLSDEEEEEDDEETASEEDL